MLTIKKRVGKGIFLYLTFAIFLTGCGRPGPRALLEGKRLLDQGRYPEAIDELNRAASLLKTNAVAYNELGLAYQHAGQASNAVPAYQKALALNHDLVETRYNLGCLWLEQNRPDAAKAELITYTTLRGNSVDGWLRLGTAELRLRELVAAEKSFDEARQISAQNPEALNGLGLVQLQRNRPREAAQFFSAALKQQPDYAPALLNLAVVSQLYLNNRPFALAKYREYLALTPRAPNWEAVNTTALGLAQDLNVASGPPGTTTVAQVNSNTSRASSNFLARAGDGSRQESAGNVPKTPPAAGQPGNVQVVKLQVEPGVRQGRDMTVVSAPYAGTEPIVTTASPPVGVETPAAGKRGLLQRINPLNLFHNDTKGQATATPPPHAANPPQVEKAKPVSGGGPEAAGASPAGFSRYHYQSPPAPAPGDNAAAGRAFAQGLHAQQANRLPEAIQAYRQAVQLDPAFYDAYCNLGLALAASGNLQSALSTYELALAIKPDAMEARFYFGQTLRQANYLVDAAVELEKVVASHPNYGPAHLALANLYARQLRQPARAREHYVKVLELEPHNPAADDIRYWLVANPP
jgi:tetratricopeptide (TPR) repeat protein